MGKPRLRRALHLSVLSMRDLAREAGVPFSVVVMAFQKRLDADEAEPLIRTLKKEANLSAEESKEVLFEVVNFPGEKIPLALRVLSSEADPMSELYAAFEERYGEPFDNF